MRKLTLLAIGAALGAAIPVSAEDRSGPVTDLVQALPTLPAAAAAAPDTAGSAKLVRDAARAKLGLLTDGEVVVALIALSDALAGQDRHDLALRLGERAVAITNGSKLGAGLLFDALSRTGGARYNLDDYGGAARDLDAARTAAARIEPFDANSVANATANYAIILDNAGRYREAEAALRESIALRAKAVEQRPANIAVAWAALAAVHMRMGRHDLAEQDYRTALAMFEDAKQTGSNPYAMSLHNYGVMMGDVGRDADAAAVFRRAIALRPAEARYAPSMINDYTSLADALIGLGRYDEAAAAVRDAERAAAGKTKPDSSSINVISARVTLASRRGDRAAAERDAATAVAQTRQIVAPTSIRLAHVLGTLSDTQRRNGKPDDAVRTADEAVTIGATIPDRNPLKALLQDTRAAALIDAGQPEQALAASRAAAEIQARRFAEESERTPVPLQIEEREIMQRRLTLLWSASHS